MQRPGMSASGFERLATNPCGGGLGLKNGHESCDPGPRMGCWTDLISQVWVGMDLLSLLDGTIESSLGCPRWWHDERSKMTARARGIGSEWLNSWSSGGGPCS
jgi:hypothetical protein